MKAAAVRVDRHWRAWLDPDAEVYMRSEPGVGKETHVAVVEDGGGFILDLFGDRQWEAGEEDSYPGMLPVTNVLRG